MKPPRSQPVLDAEITDAMANAIVPVELSVQQRDRMRARILKRAAETAPMGMHTMRAAEGTWQRVCPGVELKVLHVESANNMRSILLRMEPGSQVPLHSHTQEEQCLVLEGEVTLGEHIFRPGDWHVAMPGTTHIDFATKTGCL